MLDNTVSTGLIWDFAVSDAVDESQRWVLSTMQRYGQELVTMLWRILGNEQDVCDAYQDTFLRLAHYEGRRKPDHIKAYVFRTASNTAISMLRRRIVEARFVGREFAKKTRTANTESSPANEVDSMLLQETLRCCIAQLPEHLRSVITLRDLAELSYAQIAAILGISAATARVYRCKAMQLLAVWMNKQKEMRK
jgi:RNA polymerase sigma-70 factor (ECF subfamily)